MLNHSDLKSLLAAMRVSRVTALEVKNRTQRLRLFMPVSVSPATQSALLVVHTEAMPDAVQASVNSPTIGTFLRRGVDDGLVILEPGMPVLAGEVLGYVCQGPVRIVLDAQVNGVLIDAGPDDGAVLGFNDAVFNLEVTL